MQIMPAAAPFSGSRWLEGRRSGLTSRVLVVGRAAATARLGALNTSGYCGMETAATVQQCIRLVFGIPDTGARPLRD